MPVTSPDSISYPDTSYTSGIVAAMAAQATSVQTALSTRAIKAYRWANAAARAAETGMSAGDEGWQTDTTMHYLYDGSAWLPDYYTTAFTASSTVSLDSVFPTRYTSFDVVAQFERSTSLSVGIRLRLSGADNSASNYDLEQHFGSSATSSAGATANGSQWANVSGTAATRAVLRFTLFSPNTTDYTMGILQGAASGTLIQHFGLLHDVATAFDGLSLITSTGNITGTISVRGIA